MTTIESGGNVLGMDLSRVKKAALVLRAVNHTLRQRMLKLLHEHGRITVTDIYVKLRLAQPVASQHLAILRKAGFVKTERDGKFIYYLINAERFESVNAFVENLLSAKIA